MFNLSQHIKERTHANDNNTGWARDDWIDAMYERLFNAFDRCEQMIMENYDG